MKQFFNGEIEVLIQQYRKASESADQKQKAELYERLLTAVRELVYFIPQKSMGINEEDCAEFMLYFEGRVNNLIESYDESYGDFMSFIYPVLALNVKGFLKKKQQKARKESSVIFGHSAYEFILEEMDNSTDLMIASDNTLRYGESNVVVNRLREVFLRAPKARERFYVYFISFSLSLSEYDIVRICNLFNFDITETKQIISYYEKDRSSEQIELSNAIERRNEYYAKKLFLESELLKLNSLADHSKDSFYFDKIEKCEEHTQNQLSYIKKYYRRISRSQLSSLFNRNDGTIAVYMFFSRNLVEWCMDVSAVPNTLSNPFGITEKVMNEVICLNGKSNLKAEDFPILYPIKTFRIRLH